MDQKKQKEYAYSNVPIEVGGLDSPPEQQDQVAPPEEMTEGEVPLEAPEATETAEAAEALEATEAAPQYEAIESEAPLEAPEAAEPLEATEGAPQYEAIEGEMPSEAPETAEPLEAAEAQPPYEATEGEVPLEAPEATELTEPLESPEAVVPEAVAPTETAETASWSQPEQSPLVSTAPPPPSFEGSSFSERLAEFLQFLNRTKRVWVIAASSIFALVVVAVAAKRVSEWTRVPQTAPGGVVATNITPEVLTTRCGQPAADVTTEMYPLLTRTMTYEAGNQTYVFSFSRTAEKNSDWVFLSMKDVSGTNSYDTPEAEVAAMACLNSGK